VKAGASLGDKDVFFAIPTQDGHVTANDWSKYTQYVATRDIRKGEAILADNTDKTLVRAKVYDIVQKARRLLEEGRISFPGEAQLEISHHYGLDKFDEFGIVMITVVNRGYCKKLILTFPGQKHPEQYHNKKEETFHVLHGELLLDLDGERRICRPGDVVTVEPGVRHAFTTDTGVVVEEISSTHFIDDSYYTDESIGRNPHRKTFITHWLGA
jgi:mannose-6-phosphate isomerase-like protein (cupin superfamily)